MKNLLWKVGGIFGVVRVNEQGLDDDQDLVHVGTHEVVELVQHTIHHLDQQVAFLVFEGGRHEQGENGVEERPSTKPPRLFCEVPQSRLALRRGAVLDAQLEAVDCTTFVSGQ